MVAQTAIRQKLQEAGAEIGQQTQFQKTAPSLSPPDEPPNNAKRNRLLWWLTIILVLAALVWLLLYLFYFRFHEWTDDAYANGNLLNVNSAVSGNVIAFYADNTDLVKEGQLLVELDSTDYLIHFEQALASLASTVLNLRQLYEEVRVNQANVDNRMIALSRARYDYDNRSQLVGSEAVSREDFTHSRDDLATAKTAHKQAEAQLAAAQAAVGNTSLEQHPLLEQAKASVHQAYYNLVHCSVYAPATGHIAQRTVNVGQWVSPTTAMMAIIPTEYVWVDANFKETQLTYMRIGQPVTVTFDIYGSGIKYEGKVLGIASGTGSVFSLIPPQNATGNWIKIVQRLAVRVSLDPKQVEKFPTRLGISAVVTVDITNQDLPKLAVETSTKPIATTWIYDIHLDRVNKIIEEVIQKNLKQP